MKKFILLVLTLVISGCANVQQYPSALDNLNVESNQVCKMIKRHKSSIRHCQPRGFINAAN